METTANCESCGTQALVGAAFCASCGSSLKRQQPPEENQTGAQAPPPSQPEEKDTGSPALQPQGATAPPAPPPGPAPVQTTAPATPPAPPISTQSPSGQTSAANVSLSDIITALGFIGVLVVFFALPFASNEFGQNVSTTDELGRVGDYADVTGAASLIYALWAVPVLAGLGLGLQLLPLLNAQERRPRWQSSVWCGGLIIVALFVSSGGYAALVSKIQDLLSATGGKSSTEVFLFPITGIGNDFPGYTMMTVCAAFAVLSAWIGRSSPTGS